MSCKDHKEFFAFLDSQNIGGLSLKGIPENVAKRILQFVCDSEPESVKKARENGMVVDIRAREKQNKD